MSNTSMSDCIETVNLSRENAPIPLDLVEIKKELYKKCRECQERGLVNTVKLLAEIQHALRSTKICHSDSSFLVDQVPDMDDEYESYMLAKAYFDLKEYDRCSFFTKSFKSPRNVFLHFYSRYLSGEKKNLESMTDAVKPVDHNLLGYLRDLKVELQKIYDQGGADGYLLYLFGVVLKKLEISSLSLKVLVESLHKEPCNWAAWQELIEHIDERQTLQDLDLPEHWLKHLFSAHIFQEMQLNETALEIYFGLQAGGFQDSSYLLAQVAISFHNMKHLDQAVCYFKRLLEIDPYRLDNIDTYSNLLYVKENRIELAYLAHKCVEIDKYRVETCCVVGNYYSIRSQHEKAVQYFQRALKLNPSYLCAWTLMGHEYMELKNTNAAIDCYRKAIKSSHRDYRAWYGLGQTYEILKMPLYSLHYYKKAQELRPNDSRMLVALGQTYERIGKHQDALKCYWKACCVGDVEGDIAICQLAKTYETLEEPDQAAEAFERYVLINEERGHLERDQMSQAYKFLANYHLSKKSWVDAYKYAQRCLNYVDGKTDGKMVLKEIAKIKAKEKEAIPAYVEDYLSDEDQGSDTDCPTHTHPTDETDDFMQGQDSLERRDMEPMNLTFTP